MKKRGGFVVVSRRRSHWEMENEPPQFLLLPAEDKFRLEANEYQTRTLMTSFNPTTHPPPLT